MTSITQDVKNNFLKEDIPWHQLQTTLSILGAQLKFWSYHAMFQLA
jgi:acetone carboxylase gamma subunit